MKSKTSTIVIEVRNPRNLYEKHVAGSTQIFAKNTVKIFINKREAAKNQGWNYHNTVYHELSHALCLISDSCTLEDYTNEELATLVGCTMEGILKGFVSGESNFVKGKKIVDKFIKQKKHVHNIKSGDDE
jgi:hypothetical protein